MSHHPLDRHCGRQERDRGAQRHLEPGGHGTAVHHVDPDRLPTGIGWPTLTQRQRLWLIADLARRIADEDAAARHAEREGMLW